jgi:hypothetical protein
MGVKAEFASYNCSRLSPRSISRGLFCNPYRMKNRIKFGWPILQKGLNRGRGYEKLKIYRP